MASIGNSLPATQSAGSPSNSTSNTTAAADPLANQSTFLKLLVAQLQNQDPAQPMEGTTFVTQLAQFSNVEQSLAMRQDIDAVSEKYLGTTTAPSAATSTDASGSSTNNGTNANAPLQS